MVKQNIGDKITKGTKLKQSERAEANRRMSKINSGTGGEFLQKRKEREAEPPN